MTLPVHALVIEDDPGFVSFLGASFGLMRFLHLTYDHAAYLSTALQALDSKSYDVILLDLGLPDSTGIESVVAVIKAAPNTPVIILSGREDIGVAQNAIRAGAQTFVSKAERKLRNSTKTVNEALDPDYLERVILFAMEHKRQSIEAKQMLVESHARLSDSTGKVAQGHMIEPHIRRCEEAVGTMLTYLATNAPAHFDSAKEILDREGYYLGMREARSLLLLSASRSTRPAPPNAIAALRKAARSQTHIQLDTAAAARSQLMDAAYDYSDSEWGDEDG